MEESSKRSRTTYWNGRTHSQRQLLTHAGYSADGRINMATRTQDLLKPMTAWHSRLQAMRKKRAIRKKKSPATNEESQDTTRTNVTKKTQ